MRRTGGAGSARVPAGQERQGRAHADRSPRRVGTLATDINDRGQIVSAYENPDAMPDDQQSPMQMPMMMSGDDG
jgi:hypothetical protein